MPDEIEVTHIVSNIDTQRTIKQEDLQALRAASAELDALYAAGVDNWEGYKYAMESLIE